MNNFYSKAETFFNSANITMQKRKLHTKNKYLNLKKYAMCLVNVEDGDYITHFFNTILKKC